jgi:hypothetical protein
MVEIRIMYNALRCGKIWLRQFETMLQCMLALFEGSVSLKEKARTRLAHFLLAVSGGPGFWMGYRP